MVGTETADLIEWRPSFWWTLEWLALMLFVGLPFVAFGGWLATREIGKAIGAVPLWYTVFCFAFVGLILGAIAIGMLIAVAQYMRLLFDSRHILRANRHGIEARTPDRPMRAVQWTDIAAIEIERIRQTGRYRQYLNHIVIRLRDPATKEMTIKPQMAEVSLEDAHAKLNAMFERFR